MKSMERLSLSLFSAIFFLHCGPMALVPDGGTRIEDGATVLADGALSPTCQSELDTFRTDVWVPLFSVSCVGCHNTAGTARATRFVLRSETQDGWLEHNFQATRAMVTTELAGVPMLLLKPTGRHPMGHTGGTLAPPGSTGYAALERFAASARTPECEGSTTVPSGDGGTTMTARCTQPVPGPRVLRRLTADEYDHTVADLLGTTTRVAERFAADPVVDGFRNDAHSLVVSPLLAEQLRVAAETLAEEGARNMARIVPCAPTEATCARRFVETFGQRAFRRPLSTEEVQRYTQLHSMIAAGEGFAEGVEAVLSAMLQSPHFLYRSELGTRVGSNWQLTPWEIASELSYMLTGTMPDDALFEAARSGALGTPAGIDMQARRLMNSPNARVALRNFVRQWLDVEQLATVPKDPTTFPAFSTMVRASMSGEFDRYVDSVLGRSDARFPDLLTSSFTFVDPTLATFYGLMGSGTADPQGYRRVEMPEMHRVGVLALGAVLATHGRPNSSSPVHRGRMVRERLLCQALPPPPPGVNAQPPMPDPRLSLREQYADHSRMHPCVDCHRLIDPIGFTFEHFDGVGRYRTMENGRAIDAQGEIVGSVRTNGPLTDLRSLVERLAMSEEVHDCFARQLFRYAYAVGVTEQTSCVLNEVQQQFRQQNLSVGELLLALTRSVHFTQRSGDDAVVVGGDAGMNSDAAATPDAPSMMSSDAGSAVDAMRPPTGMSTPGVTTTVTRDSMWDTGFCERVQVTNGTSASVEWTVVHEVMGRVTTSWNSERTGESGAIVFRGSTWNRTLAPGERTEFGLCAMR